MLTHLLTSGVYNYTRGIIMDTDRQLVSVPIGNPHYALLLLLGYAWTDDSFIPFDCSSPKNTEFFDHKVCHKHSDRLKKKKFVV